MHFHDRLLLSTVYVLFVVAFVCLPVCSRVVMRETLWLNVNGRDGLWDKQTSNLSKAHVMCNSSGPATLAISVGLQQ